MPSKWQISTAKICCRTFFLIERAALLTLSGSYSLIILHTFLNKKQYWRFQRVTGKQYYILFQSLHQTILSFSEIYWQTILHTFPEFISSNPDIFREFLPFFRVHITQYWYFQRVTTNNIDLFRAHVEQYSHFHRVTAKQ